MWAAILIPLLFALPFMILGWLNGEWKMSVGFGVAIASLSASLFLNAQKAAFDAQQAIADNGHKTFGGADGLLFASVAAAVLMTMFIIAFAVKAQNLFDHQSSHKIIGVVSIWTVAGGVAAVMASNVFPGVDHTQSWVPHASTIGVLSIVVGLAVFGMCFAWQSKMTEMGILAIAGTVALGIIGVESYQIINSTLTAAYHAHSMYLIGGCGLFLAAVTLLAFILKTNFGDKWKCNLKGKVGKGLLY